MGSKLITDTSDDCKYGIRQHPNQRWFTAREHPNIVFNVGQKTVFVKVEKERKRNTCSIPV